MRTPVFAANWKMNKLSADVPSYFTGLTSKLSGVRVSAACEVVIAPPAILLKESVLASKGSGIEIAAQNSGPAKSGAFTGEISPGLVRETGCHWVILGHSERRHVFKETGELIGKRLVAALGEGLKVIFCVGELLEERRAGKTFSVVGAQLLELKVATPIPWNSIVVAYEPVWAIGTGENATPEEAQEVHRYLRAQVAESAGSPVAERLRVLYGGSVKSENAGILMKQPDVDGLLVGGASLDPYGFAEIIRSGLTSRPS